jgi:hypothetical protein
MERQIGIAEQSAQAAKEKAVAAAKSAETAERTIGVLIDSERAWVLVSRVGAPDKHGWYAPDVPQYVPGMAFEFEVFGKTAVRITDARFDLRPFRAKARFAPSWEPVEPDLPAVPDYTRLRRSAEIPEDGQVVIPGRRFQIMVGLPQTLNVNEWESLRDEQTAMCAYGFIGYESLGGQYATAVCYVYRFHWGGVITATDGTRLNPPGFEIGVQAPTTAVPNARRQIRTPPLFDGRRG